MTGPDSKPVLASRGITRCDPAGGAVLLYPSDLDLYPGDRIAITGPTGSGKSLLLRTLALLDSPADGTLVWHGQAVLPRDVPRYRHHISYIAQRPAMLEGTVEDNLRYPFSLSIYRNARFEPARVENLLEKVGRDYRFLSRDAGDLSGGEAQFVALIRVLQLGPDVLLLDEPTASLDPASATAIETLVTDWFQNNECRTRAYIWVSHDQEQATRMGTTRLTMQDGKLTEAER